MMRNSVSRWGGQTFFVIDLLVSYQTDERTFCQECQKGNHTFDVILLALLIKFTALPVVHPNQPDTCLFFYNVPYFVNFDT